MRAMTAVWLGVALGSATAVQAANEAGPMRDLGWGATPADNGIAYVPFDTAGASGGHASLVALQPDGKLVLGGVAAAPSGGVEAFARLLQPHGALDLGFGTAGRVRLGPLVIDGPTSMAITADGKIVYTAFLTSTTFVIWRLLADGTPDMSFDLDGRRAFSVTAFMPLGSILRTQHVVAQPDGKIVIFTGAGRTAPDVQVYAVATRLNIDGSTDTTFGGQGTGVGRYAPNNDGTPVAQANAAVLLPDGQFVVGGIAYRSGGSSSDLITFRLSANGVLDTGYGTDGFGIVAFDQGGLLDDYLSGVAVDSAGRAVVTGNFDDATNRPRAAVARFTASGQADTSFGAGGRVFYAVHADATREYSRSVAVLSGDRILVAGTTVLCECTQAIVGTITQFESNGQINRLFGVDGTELIGRYPGPEAQVLYASQMAVSGDYAYLVGSADLPSATNVQAFASTRVIVPLFRSGFDGGAPAPPDATLPLPQLASQVH